MSSVIASWRPTPVRSSKRTGARNHPRVVYAMDNNRLGRLEAFGSRDSRRRIPLNGCRIRLAPRNANAKTTFIECDGSSMEGSAVWLPLARSAAPRKRHSLQRVVRQRDLGEDPEEQAPA